jgi:small subunit ribosomal protein S20
MAKRTASAKKQARAGVRRSARNKAAKSAVKTMIVKARRSFIESPVAEADRASLTLAAIRSLDRASAKGILHRNNVARRKARLMRQLVKVAGTAAKAPAGRKAAAAPAPPPPAKKGKK